MRYAVTMSTSENSSDGLRARPYPTSLTQYRFAIACGVISLCAFTILILRVPDVLAFFWPIIGTYGRGVVSVLSALMMVHFVVCLLIQLRKNGGATGAEKTAWYGTYFRQLPLINIISATAALILTTTSFTVHKGAAIGAAGYHYDAALIAWDRMIFAGNDAWTLTHRLIPSETVTQWIDFLYHPAFFPMLIGYLLCINLQGLQTLRQTYMISYLASFVIIGMVSAGALHSAGPLFDGVIFGDGSTFNPLIDRLRAQFDAGSGPQTSTLIRAYLINLNQADEIKMGAGISAMPSMHIVLAFLWVFPAWHIHRFLGLFMTLYGMVIWFGSVHLGWHYFVDGLVALIMISAIWYCSGRLMGLYGKA